MQFTRCWRPVRGSAGGIQTSRLWPDLPIDLGASWIHGQRGNPLMTLANEAGARVVPTSYDAANAAWARWGGESTQICVPPGASCAALWRRPSGWNATCR